MQQVLAKGLASVRNEWSEAPWFVILIVAVVAFVGPGILWATWDAIFGLVT